MNNTTKEIKSAITFLVKQMKRGWNATEAMNQVETSYGQHIKNCVIYYIKQNVHLFEN